MPSHDLDRGLWIAPQRGLSEADPITNELLSDAEIPALVATISNIGPEAVSSPEDTTNEPISLRFEKRVPAPPRPRD